MEPLILEGAELRRPVFAAYTKGGRRLHVGLQEMGGASSCPHCCAVLQLPEPAPWGDAPCNTDASACTFIQLTRVSGIFSNAHHTDPV